MVLKPHFDKSNDRHEAWFIFLSDHNITDVKL